MKTVLVVPEKSVGKMLALLAGPALILFILFAAAFSIILYENTLGKVIDNPFFWFFAVAIQIVDAVLVYGVTVYGVSCEFPRNEGTGS